MIKKREQKRAVSTLIATVLMIGVVMAAAFLVQQGYQGYIKSKAKEIQKELVKTYCPQEFDFELEACYIKDIGGEKGILSLRVDSKYGEISNKSRILMSGGGKSVWRETLALGNINPALPIEADISYTLSEFKDGIIEKVKLMPLFEEEEQKITVICDNLPEFDVALCSPGDRCIDGAKPGKCSEINPGLYCKSIDTENILVYDCTMDSDEQKCPCPGYLGYSSCCTSAASCQKGKCYVQIPGEAYEYPNNILSPPANP